MYSRRLLRSGLEPQLSLRLGLLVRRLHSHDVRSAARSRYLEFTRGRCQRACAARGAGQGLGRKLPGVQLRVLYCTDHAAAARASVSSAAVRLCGLGEPTHAELEVGSLYSALLESSCMRRSNSYRGPSVPLSRRNAQPLAQRAAVPCSFSSSPTSSSFARRRPTAAAPLFAQRANMHTKAAAGCNTHPSAQAGSEPEMQTMVAWQAQRKFNRHQPRPPPCDARLCFPFSAALCPTGTPHRGPRLSAAALRGCLRAAVSSTFTRSGATCARTMPHAR